MLSVGCSGSNNPGRAAVGREDPGAAGYGSAIVEELLGLGQTHAMSTWLSQRVRQCMARRGFDKNVSSATTTTLDYNALAFRQQFGLGISLEPPHDAGVVELNIAPAERQQFLNAMDDCEHSADDSAASRLSAIEANLPTRARKLLQGIRETRDPRLLGAQRGWSSCMERAGYEFDNQVEMSQQLSDTAAQAKGPALHAVRDRERVIAIADLSCSKQQIDPVFRQCVRELDGLLAHAGQTQDAFG